MFKANQKINIVEGKETYIPNLLKYDCPCGETHLCQAEWLGDETNIRYSAGICDNLGLSQIIRIRDKKPNSPRTSTIEKILSSLVIHNGG